MFSFSFQVKSFVQNLNFMVLVHVLISVAAVYMFQTFDISFDTNVALFVSPIGGYTTFMSHLSLDLTFNFQFSIFPRIIESQQIRGFGNQWLNWYELHQMNISPGRHNTEFLILPRRIPADGFRKVSMKYGFHDF